MANKRQQINTVTSFTDLSTVYGSEDQLALDLRDLTSDAGLMRVNDKYTDNGRALLPFSPLKANMCATRRRITSKSTAEEVPCFLAGWCIYVYLYASIYLYGHLYMRLSL